MDWSDIGKAIGKFAPLLGGAVGGPGGAAVGQLIATALGVETTPDAIKKAIDADPQAALKLQDLQNRHQERLEELALDRHKADLEAETTRHAGSQKTIQTEAQYGTDYVKETRPKMARLSGYATIAYCLTAEAAKLISLAWGHQVGGADVAVAGMLFAPCGTYMTMRTFDGFSKGGRS